VVSQAACGVIVPSLIASALGGTGQLGLGTEDDHALPQRWKNDEVSCLIREIGGGDRAELTWDSVLLQLQLKLRSVTSGGCHSAGIRGDGRLFLWGSDDRGQLGRKLSEHGQKFVSTPSQPVACSVGASVSCCAQGLGAVNMD
jgi:alpha-tubulin suppressor-like RCC1 family protein